MKPSLLTLLFSSALFAGQTFNGHAADSTTSNIFSGQTVFANSLYNQDFSYAGAVDGQAPSSNTPGSFAHEFVFQDGASNPDLLSISGFNAAAAIDSVTFFGTGEYGANRAETSVVIYTSTTDYTDQASALSTGNYTEMNGGTPFALPSTANNVAYSEGVDSAGSQGSGF